MTGSWKVTSQFIGDDKMYAVYRLRDKDAVDHSGNREFASPYMTNKQDAEDIAKRLNDEEV